MNHRCFTVFLLLSTILSAAAANAADSPAYVWRNVTVGGGGFVPGVVFSRVEKGLAYMRTDIGGCYRWDDSQKIWIPMQDAIGESNYFGGESIAPDPIDANVVYIAAGMYRNLPSAILRSRDRGKTWDIFPVDFMMGGNEDGRGVGERLAVDPNDNHILFFGSRHNGLRRSGDYAQTWRPVKGFPLKGLGARGAGPTHNGLSFVVFDPKSSSPGSATKTIFVGSADPGDQHLFRSDDAGDTWKPVPGQPPSPLLPNKAEIDDSGNLYITYGNGTGPNGVTDGAVMKLDTHRGQWTDITPDKRPDRPRGGYCGLSLDRQHPGTLGVTTMNRWGPVDTVWRSTDGGNSWMDIVGKSERNVTSTPFLLWGKNQAKLGWWMAAFAIDPFDSDHAAYGTGATVFATNDFSNVNKDQPTHWYPWVNGVEETAILTLLSPGEGAHLLSAFGDIGGFVHDDLNASPRDMFENPQFSTTVTLDCAGAKPSVIVRSGRPNDGEASLGYSDDGGHTWQPLTAPADNQRSGAGRFRRGTPPIIVSADGSTLMLLTRTPVISRDRGKTWTASAGLFAGAHCIADRVAPQTFYALDFSSKKLYTSTDGGATFSASPVDGLPADIRSDAPTWEEAPWPLVATPGKQGDLWLVSRQGLFHSADGGKNFVKTESSFIPDAISLGKAPPGAEYPAVFAIGTNNGLKAIWRSDDAGKSWMRINDDQHQYGTRYRCIAADPRVFGRAYIGTDGRGILYGEPAASNAN